MMEKLANILKKGDDDNVEKTYNGNIISTSIYPRFCFSGTISAGWLGLGHIA
jgi:hypothetical protein